MSAHTRMHPYLNLAKERIDEMDAFLKSLESEAGSKAKRDEVVRDLKQRRAEFAAAVKNLTDAGEKTLERARAELESKWTGFEAQIEVYMETAGKEAVHRQAIFREMAAAQTKAWRETAEKLLESAQKAAAAQQPEIDAAAKRMKAEAAEAETQLHKFKAAGTESWAAYSAALAQSRKAFERANETAWKAAKHVTAH